MKGDSEYAAMDTGSSTCCVMGIVTKFSHIF